MYVLLLYDVLGPQLPFEDKSILVSTYSRPKFDINLLMINSAYLQIEKNVVKTTEDGKFLSDGIASELFIVNLKN